MEGLKEGSSSGTRICTHKNLYPTPHRPSTRSRLLPRSFDGLYQLQEILRPARQYTLSQRVLYGRKIIGVIVIRKAQGCGNDVP